MIQTTNDVCEFIEEHKEPIYIYGAGNPGKWVGIYMQRCNIPFDGYIDKGGTEAVEEDMKLNNAKVFHPTVLSKQINHRVRVIVAVFDVSGALADLHWFFGEKDLYCLVPHYKDFVSGERVYDINCLLSYFRGKLVKTEVPTILSNQCDAGFVYRMLGIPIKSPTINMGMEPQDFIKFCKYSEKYLRTDMEPNGKIMESGRCASLGKVGDISIMLPHDQQIQEAVKRWNTLRKWVDYNNLVFIMSDSAWPIPQAVQKEFLSLPGKKLLILTRSMYVIPKCGCESVLYVTEDCLKLRNSACENYFDILGWINGEF